MTKTISYKEKIRDQKQQFKFFLLKTISKYPLLCSFYYVVNSSFRREHHSVINGKYRYHSNQEGAVYKLRRNIHRIEKGLIMIPRRDNFATSYIEETIEAFEILSKEKSMVDDSTFNWFNDVLEEYFKVTGNHPNIIKMREKYSLIISNLESDERVNRSIPYLRNLGEKPKVTINEFIDLSILRRSVRFFEDKKVPREMIDKAIYAAGLSPSACNRQPYKFRVFDDPKLVSEIAELPGGTAGYRDNIPVIVAVTGELGAYPFERDRHVIYIDSSLAAMSFLYGLEVQGISSCIINWPDVEHREAKIAEFLNLEKDERVIMLIALGFPNKDAKVPFSSKKNLNTIRRYN
ncbi:nitroreductase family protein [Rossellomorea sp. NPDC071047]|uniref:nitroreductase family protein n=1 Tax=Rossellomorea sp. NPDC071047 TaxID=3390675 RepID=UPI003D00CB8D